MAILGVVVVALVLVLYSNRMAERASATSPHRRPAGCSGSCGASPVTWGGENFERFRVEAVGLLSRRWHVLTLATFAGSLTVFAVLLVSLRALAGLRRRGHGACEAFAAWSLARLLGSIPITPGGIGVVELSLTATLIGFGGDNAGVVAAVLVFRFLTMVPTLVLGLLAAPSLRPKTADAEAP